MKIHDLPLIAPTLKLSFIRVVPKNLVEMITLIWVGFSGIHFEVEGGGEIRLLPPLPPPWLKLVRVNLET